MYWWTSLKRERRLHREPPITYWNDLRGALRRRHIPSYYHRELMDKLQRLLQKNMSVEEYCTALVVGSDDVASSYSMGVLTRRQVGRKEGSRGAREVASY